CISSGDGWDLGTVESRKMNRYFGMMVLQTVFRTWAEACPPPSVHTTNMLQPFGHRRGKKTPTRPIRVAQPVEPLLTYILQKECDDCGASWRMLSRTPLRPDSAAGPAARNEMYHHHSMKASCPAALIWPNHLHKSWANCLGPSDSRLNILF